MRAWLAVPAVLIGLLACQRESERPSVDALVGQLEGRSFRFRAEGDRCNLRRDEAFPANLLSWLLGGTTTSPAGPRRPAVSASWVRPPRRAGSAAGPQLRPRRSRHRPWLCGGRHRVRAERGDRGSRAHRRQAGRGPLAAVRATQPAHARVTLEALQVLGPLASGQARLITAVLTLEQDLARRAVVERQHTNRTRHVFQDAEVAAALSTLDRRSPEYLKQREGVCRDAVAEAALRALAEIRCEACLPPIVAALREPWLATAAAWELGRIRPLPPAAGPALRAVISSPSHGPLALESARRRHACPSDRCRSHCTRSVSPRGGPAGHPSRVCGLAGATGEQALSRGRAHQGSRPIQPGGKGPGCRGCSWQRKGGRRLLRRCPLWTPATTAAQQWACSYRCGCQRS
jgi:hypothetical protein